MANLILVEDDDDVVEPIMDLLRAEGHVVRRACNGEEGLELLQTEAPELILSDVEMPLLTGPEMAFQMFIHDAGEEQIPVVLLSGIADLREIAERMGTSYYLAKPFSANHLVAVVNRALAERLPPSPKRSP